MSYKEVRQISDERMRHLFWMLVLASAISCGMLAIRYIFAGTMRFSYLFGNLLLAWIPMVLAYYIPKIPRARFRVGFWGAVCLWVLFFPNAFYIVTDLIHVRKFGTEGIFHWYDMAVTTNFAIAGMFLGLSSLYLMHLFVRRLHGLQMGWRFAIGILALGAFGMFLGRTLRLNSWDIIRPWRLFEKISTLANPPLSYEVTAFSVTYFFLSLGAYAFFVCVARLHEGHSPDPGGESTVPESKEGIGSE